MRTTTAHNHYCRLKNKMANIYSCAVYDRPTHKELVARVVAEVWNDPGLKLCPGWVSSKLQVCRDFYSELLWRHVRWYHIGSDGKQYASFDDLPESDKELCRQDKLNSGFFWVKRQQTKQACGTTETVTETITPTLSRF